MKTDETTPNAEQIDAAHRRSQIAKALTGAFRVVRTVTAEDPRAGDRKLKRKLILVLGCACEACRTAMPAAGLLHLHHIVTVERGGLTETSNVALLCPNCHARAHWADRHLLEEERPKTRADLIGLLTRIAHVGAVPSRTETK